MNPSMVELSASLQSLVDERLDTIERVLLMGGVSRGERRGIAGEVEAHVFELLGRRTSGEPTREDVLAVISQLDPPESYAPDGFDRRMLEAGWSAARRREPRVSLPAVSSAAIGALVAPALALSEVLSGNDEVTILFALALLAVSIVGCSSLVRIHRSQGWLYGMRPALFAALLFPLLALNCMAAIGVIALGELAVMLGLAIAFLTFNGAIIYVAWRFCSIGYSRANTAGGLA